MRNASPHDIEQARARIEAARLELASARAEVVAAHAESAAARAQRDAALAGLARLGARPDRPSLLTALPLWLHTVIVCLAPISWVVAIGLAIGGSHWWSLFCSGANIFVAIVFVLSRVKSGRIGRAFTSSRSSRRERSTSGGITW